MSGARKPIILRKDPANNCSTDPLLRAGKKPGDFNYQVVAISLVDAREFAISGGVNKKERGKSVQTSLISIYESDRLCKLPN